DCQRALEERAYPRQITLSPQQAGEIVEAHRRMRILRTEAIFVDCHCTLKERPSCGEFALRLKQMGEVVDARRGMGMVGAERVLADRHQVLAERPRLLIGPKYSIPI